MMGNSKIKCRRADRGLARSGFTLVEMLVSVALVLLMMSLFASIFSMASGSVSTQRGISNHDQKARALTTLIKGDFSHRTHRYPLPFYPKEDPAISSTPFGNRAGYLYISTNDPYSGQDDLVQFTVSADMLQEDTDSSPYYGRASMLLNAPLPPNAPASILSSLLSVNPNQPEADDSSLTVNNTGSSSAAEVAYFVRNGNLYRRVMLLRQPLPVAGRELDDQPMARSGDQYFSLPQGQGRFLLAMAPPSLVPNQWSDDFWTHFDYSARAVSGNGTAQFIGIAALNNEQAATVPSLGKPDYRFGFNQVTGFSREHAVLNGAFIGRFLHAETSSTNFNWPQRPALLYGSANQVFPGGNNADGNPLNIANPVTLNTTTGIVDEFCNGVAGSGRGGSRRMEDLVLSDVHEMKVEVWDERLQKYTTPGHSEYYRDANGSYWPGDFHRHRSLSGTEGYGPELNSTGVFDTWHPFATVDGGITRPAFIPYRYAPPRESDGGITPDKEDPSLGRSPVRLDEPDRITGRPDNKGYWAAVDQNGNPKSYSVGDVVFAPWTDTNGNGRFDFGENGGQAFSIAYRCVLRDTSKNHTAPAGFPTSPGRRVREANGAAEWESFDNRRPLTSIRMTLRFHDQTSDTQRNLTLVLPLTDKK